MQAAGIGKVYPADGRLARLLAEGISVQELADTARECVGKGKDGFAYTLAVVEGRRREALHQPPINSDVEAFGARLAKLMKGGLS